MNSFQASGGSLELRILVHPVVLSEKARLESACFLTAPRGLGTPEVPVCIGIQIRGGGSSVNRSNPWRARGTNANPRNFDSRLPR